MIKGRPAYLVFCRAFAVRSKQTLSVKMDHMRWRLRNPYLRFPGNRLGIIPIKKEKTNLLIAFAQKNKVIYGNAFDDLSLQ